MPQAPPTRPGRTCPNCHAFVPQGNPRCQSCKLEVKQMDTFAAAKKAAQAKGKRGVTEPREVPFFLRPGNIALLLLVVAIAATAWYYLRPKPPRYIAFPATAQDATQQFLNHIAADSDPETQKAYDMIADSVRDPKADDERGDYQQVFHTINLYLSGEFGDAWAAQAQLAPDPANPDIILAKVGGLETLHIHTQQQTPPDKMKDYKGPHYAITGVDDFNVADAADMRKMAAITDIIGGIAGKGSLNDFNTILGASAANRHQPRMLKKIDLLAVNRNPRTATWKSIIQMYPLRDDPVVKNRLTLIVDDERYDPGVREKAKAVLADRVPEEDFVAAGVDH